MAISGAIDGVVGARGVCDDFLETAYSTGIKSIDIDDGFKGLNLSKDFDSLNYNKTFADLMTPEEAARYNQYWDDLEKTRLNVVDEATDILDEIGESVPNVSSKPNSTTLRKQLVESGISVPDYPNAAHHIVAGNSPKASEARAIMQKFGIDINDASNGVFLPTKKGVTDATYHPSLHTNSYYDKVNKMLSGATCKEDVLDILEFIADELSLGTFI